jgi:hypothetical protein
MQGKAQEHPAAGTSMTIGQVIGSVASSFFGVQSSRNRERDFKHGNPLVFLAVGFVMTGVVALVFYGAAQLALLRVAAHG